MQVLNAWVETQPVVLAKGQINKQLDDLAAARLGANVHGFRDQNKTASKQVCLDRAAANSQAPHKAPVGLRAINAATVFRQLQRGIVHVIRRRALPDLDGGKQTGVSLIVVVDYVYIAVQRCLGAISRSDSGQRRVDSQANPNSGLVGAVVSSTCSADWRSGRNEHSAWLGAPLLSIGMLMHPLNNTRYERGKCLGALAHVATAAASVVVPRCVCACPPGKRIVVLPELARQLINGGVARAS
ncbi:hypothetical protein BX661DRAFT_43708 [Kickxella alabastrina]|uniref:uncharacterized protein n=1 Tax=Kickxella alabastrina TaxID=61397 RepID=UPI002220E0ED|nr:uncharacterized protein BX661DRAFT_43708 [Kickxella alabastrina]KAI7824483.1 hypothetical protein BX661DRAFT_43708 [Kickxella alabastrina]